MIKNFLVKKKTKKFTRHHSNRYKRIKVNWRKPRGIDSCVRRKFKGKNLMPNIGYGNEFKSRNLLPSGFFKLRIFNTGDLNLLSTFNQKYIGEIAKSIGTKKRKIISKKAAEMDIKLLNAL